MRRREWIIEYIYPDSSNPHWRIWSLNNSPRWSTLRDRWSSPYHKSLRFTLAGAYRIAISTQLVYRHRTIRLRNTTNGAIFNIGRLMETDLANRADNTLTNRVHVA